MALTEEQMEDLAYEADVEVYEGLYSGRGMYGKEVPALVIEDMGELIKIGMAAEREGIPYRDVPKRTDSLGRRIVVY